MDNKGKRPILDELRDPQDLLDKKRESITAAINDSAFREYLFSEIVDSVCVRTEMLTDDQCRAILSQASSLARLLKVRREEEELVEQEISDDVESYIANE